MEKDYSVRMGFMDDYVCAICDEGGDLISCGGDCGRSFHPTKPTGAPSGCKTLGLSEEQLEISKFLCKNCEYKKHQCFVCGKLGSSDKVDKKQEIFQCNKKGCNRFYHPECLPLDVNTMADDLCPMHECYSCKKKHATSGGNKTTGKAKGRGTWEMDLVLCRRCPKAFHRKCLPRKISGGIIGKIQRRWEIAGRTVFYCRDHEMANGLRSSVRGHIEFPESPKGASKNQSVLEGHVDDGNTGSVLVPKNMT